MSRIFDALQRSGFEQTGVEYPDLISVATEVLEALPKEQASKSDIVVEPPQEIHLVANPRSTTPCQEPGNNVSLHSFDVEVPSNSRLVYFTDPHSLAAEKFRFLGVRLRQLRQ